MKGISERFRLETGFGELWKSFEGDLEGLWKGFGGALEDGDLGFCALSGWRRWLSAGVWRVSERALSISNW